MNIIPTKGTMTATAAAGLIASVILTIFGHPTLSQVGSHAAAALGGLLTAIHGPAVGKTVKGKVHPPRPPKQPAKIPTFSRVFDTVTVSALRGVVTTSGEGVVGYANGSFANAAEMAAAFPDDYHADVTTTEFQPANWADVERGDLDIPGFVRYWQRFGKRPDTRGAYVDLSNFPALKAAMAAAGFILGRDYEVWIADWTGFPFIAPGSVGTQYRNTQGWDESMVITKLFFGLGEKL